MVGSKEDLLRSTQAISIRCQPIVHYSRKIAGAYEAFLHAANMEALFETCQEHHETATLLRLITQKLAYVASRLGDDVWLYFVLHPLFLDEDMDALTAGFLAPHASRVVLALPASELFDDGKHLNERCNRLRSSGYRIAVDRFCEGYSSLWRLRHVEVDVVSFSPANFMEERAIVKSVSELSCALKILPVAKGVDKKETCSMLTEVGIDWMQGSFFAPAGEPFPLVSPSAFE